MTEFAPEGNLIGGLAMLGAYKMNRQVVVSAPEKMVRERTCQVLLQLGYTKVTRGDSIFFQRPFGLWATFAGGLSTSPRRSVLSRVTLAATSRGELATLRITYDFPLGLVAAEDGDRVPPYFRHEADCLEAAAKGQRVDLRGLDAAEKKDRELGSHFLKEMVAVAILIAAGIGLVAALIPLLGDSALLVFFFALLGGGLYLATVPGASDHAGMMWRRLLDRVTRLLGS